MRREFRHPKLFCNRSTILEKEKLLRHRSPRLMTGPITAAQTAYYGDAYYRTPPPDLQSLLLKERIVYLGMPLFSSDDVKRQVGIDVTELILAQLLYLEFDNPDKPIFFYINSTGTAWYDGSSIGYETEAFAICDTLRYIKPPVHTICIGQAMGTAAMILSSGTKGHRASLPNATIVLNQPRTGAQGQATDISIQAQEILRAKKRLNEILAHHTGQKFETVEKDTDRDRFMSAEDAKAYGLVDHVVSFNKPAQSAK